MQPPRDGAGDRRYVGNRFRRRRTMEPSEHVTQVFEDAPALCALRGMALEPRPGAGRQVEVEVGGYVWGRPPMIAAEAQLVPERAHRRCDPVIGAEGSQTALKTPGAMNRFGADGVKVFVYITRGAR
jgi:hypothetical protein